MVGLEPDPMGGGEEAPAEVWPQPQGRPAPQRQPHPSAAGPPHPQSSSASQPQLRPPRLQLQPQLCPSCSSALSLAPPSFPLLPQAGFGPSCSSAPPPAPPPSPAPPPAQAPLPTDSVTGTWGHDRKRLGTAGLSISIFQLLITVPRVFLLCSLGQGRAGQGFSELYSLEGRFFPESFSKST